MTSTTNIIEPTFLVLGATGGSALAVLTRALKAGYKCNALVRTPSKLATLLEGQNLPKDALANLNIITGNAKDSTAITTALILSGHLVTYIVSGIGGAPKFTPNPLRPGLDDPTICEGTTSTVLSALRSLQSKAEHASSKPIYIVVSTTGMSDYGRDIPIACVPLYHWMLPVAHKDKKAMENLLIADHKSANPAIGGFGIVRASLLNTNPGVGVDALRIGVENGANIEKSAIGYFISRDDVGAFIFEELVEGKRGKKEAYLNRCVSVTS